MRFLFIILINVGLLFSSGSIIHNQFTFEKGVLFPNQVFTTVESYSFNSNNIEGASILNASGEIDAGATLVKRWTKKEINDLDLILTKVSTRDMPLIESECYYPRDAILFKRKGQIIGYIEICFECSRIKFDPDITVFMTEVNYLKLGAFMKEIGHQL